MKYKYILYVRQISLNSCYNKGTYFLIFFTLKQQLFLGYEISRRGEFSLFMFCNEHPRVLKCVTAPMLPIDPAYAEISFQNDSK